MTTPLSPEAVAQMVQRMRMYAVAWGERPSVSPYADTAPGLTTGRVIIDTGSAADMLTTIAAENATLRASEAAALERVKVLETTLQRIAGYRGPYNMPFPDALPEYPSFAVMEARQALTPTADKEPKT